MTTAPKIPPLDGDLTSSTTHYGGFYDTGLHYTERDDGLSPGSLCAACFYEENIAGGRWFVDQVLGTLNLTEPA